MNKTEYSLKDEITVLTNKTISTLMASNPDALTLYLFYIMCSNIQKTNQVYATNTFCMKGLSWGRKRFYDAKQILIDHNLLETVEGRTKEGKITKHYIRIKYLWGAKSKEEVLTTLPENRTVENLHCGIQPTNAYSKDSKMLKVNIYKQEANQKVNKSDISTLVKAYSTFWQFIFGFAPKFTSADYARHTKTYKKLLEVYNIPQIKLLIAMHFDWRGIDDKDEGANRWLRDNGFPTELISKNANAYVACLSKSVDFENEQACEDYYARWIKNLNKF